MQEEEKNEFQKMKKHKEKKKKMDDRNTGKHNVVEQSEEIEVDAMDVNKDHDMEEIRAEEKDELRKMEKHKEKKKKKDRKIDKSNVIEQSEEIEVDAMDVNKDHDIEEIKVAFKKHDEKKNRCGEAEDDRTVFDGKAFNGQESRTDVEKGEQEAKLDSRKDSKEEKKKKIRNSEKEDDVSSSSDLLFKGYNVMNDNVERIGGKRKDEGHKKRKSDKNKEVDKASANVQVNREAKRKKDRSAEVGGLLESFKTVIDDRQKRVGNAKIIELEKNTNHEGGITMLEDVKKRNRKKDKYSKVSTSSLAEAGINGSGNEKVHIVAVDNETSCDEACEGSNGDKRKKRKHAKVSTWFERAENDKRKRVKQALSVEDTKTAEDGADGIPSTLRIDKETKRRKEKGDNEEESLKFLSEGGSKNDMNVGDTEDKENEETSNMMKERRVGDSKASLSKEKKRKVSFSGKVEVFPLGNDSEHEENGEIKLVQGKRFTKKEDEIIKAAIEKYIEKYQLGEDGKHMILNYSSYRQVKDCWKEIGACIPYRPRKSISYRAHVILQQGEEHKWDSEDYDRIRSFHKEHGSKWKKLAEQLGKHRIHVKDAWRRIRPPNLRKGQWSQEEYQSLFDLVNIDLQMKVFQEKESKHGMLRDNISWEAISEKLSSRTSPDCCTKWYKQLTSSLVIQGIWSDADDYRLLDALQNTDACCVEDVDWDDLLEHRSGEVCRKRWNQMIRHIGGHREKSFIEQVEVLSRRYCPDMLEYRT